MVFNSIDPCQEFVFKGDAIEHVQTFKYLGILLETTSNLDSAVAHIATANRRSLFTLNRCYAELHIMDVKLCYDLFNTLVRSTTSYACDLFNMLVCSTTSYACEVWVDSNKIKAIKVVYQGFLKSLFRV
jgi:hypothetical protein